MFEAREFLRKKLIGKKVRDFVTFSHKQTLCFSLSVLNVSFHMLFCPFHIDAELFSFSLNTLTTQALSWATLFTETQIKFVFFFHLFYEENKKCHSTTLQHEKCWDVFKTNMCMYLKSYSISSIRIPNNILVITYLLCPKVNEDIFINWELLGY